MQQRNEKSDKKKWKMSTGSGNTKLTFARVISGRTEDSIQKKVKYAWTEE